MKTLITSFVLLAVSLGSVAQPAFTGNDVFSVGSQDSFKMGVFNDVYGTGMAIEQATGTNYTWDFDAAVFYLAGAFSYACTTPPTSSFIVLPPGANMRESAPGSGIENLFQTTSDTLYMMRTGSSTSSGSYMFPKLRWLSFPMNIGDSLSADQLEYVDSAMTTPGFTRTHSYMYDGFGTVKLPWGTYNNIFRIKMTTRDSSHIIAGYVNTFSNYLFFRQGGGMPIARLASSAANADSVSHAYTLIANKTATAPNSVSAVDKQNDITLYPNPVQDILNITSQSGKPLHISISDMTGKVLLSGITGSQVSMGQFARGIYLVTVCDAGDNIICYRKVAKTE